MITHICDRCGRPIFADETRYIARIEVFAAPDLPAFTMDDLQRDHSAEMQRLIDQCEGLTEEELMREVHVEMKFDLCRACQRAYLDRPLG
jgi:hypothetical protein